MTAAQSGLLATFRGLDLRVKNKLADEDSPLKLFLAALAIAHDDAGQEYLSIDEVHAALEAAEVSVKRGSLARAIARAGKKVSRRESQGEVSYHLALLGRREVDTVLGSGDLQLLYVDGNTPRTARRELGTVLGELSGVVRICDPYYGVRTLETLELFAKGCSIQFLTARTNEKAHKLAGPMKDFKKERPKVEMRTTARAQDLHDRYVLSSDRILLVGHGLKDIGAKESFVMVIPRKLAPDLLDAVGQSFDQRWAGATLI